MCTMDQLHLPRATWDSMPFARNFQQREFGFLADLDSASEAQKLTNSPSPTTGREFWISAAFDTIIGTCYGRDHLKSRVGSLV